MIITKDNSECIICRENYKDNFQNKLIASLPNCGHFYHNDCIGRWLFHQLDEQQDTSCPICRTPVLLSIAQNIADIQIVNPSDIILKMDDDSDSIYKISCQSHATSSNDNPPPSSCVTNSNQMKSENNDLPDNSTNTSNNNQFPQILNVKQLPDNQLSNV